MCQLAARKNGVAVVARRVMSRGKLSAVTTWHNKTVSEKAHEWTARRLLAVPRPPLPVGARHGKGVSVKLERENRFR